MKSLVELTAIADDPRFGDLVIMYDPNDPLSRVMKKAKQSETIEEHLQTIEQARFRQEINHPNILRLLEIDDDQQSLTASVYFEFPDSTLDMSALSSEEIILMFRDILCAIVYLQSNKMIHGDIRSDYICFSINENCYKLLDRLGDFSSPIQCQLNNINNYRALYTSPIIFNELMKQSKKIKQNSYKSECFALGMNVLGFYTEPEGVQEIYDFDNGAFNQPLFERTISSLSSKPRDALSQVFVRYLVKNVLVFEEKDRLNPQAALEELLKINELQELFISTSNETDQANFETSNLSSSHKSISKTVHYNPFEFIDKTSVQARNLIKAEIFGDASKKMASNQNMPQAYVVQSHYEPSKDHQLLPRVRHESDIDINKFIMSNPKSISNIKNAIVNNSVKSTTFGEQPQPAQVGVNSLNPNVPGKELVPPHAINPEISQLHEATPQNTSPVQASPSLDLDINNPDKKQGHQNSTKVPTPFYNHNTQTYEPTRDQDYRLANYNSPNRIDYLQDIASLENFNFAHNSMENMKREDFDRFGHQFITSPAQLDQMPPQFQMYQNFGYNSQQNMQPCDYQPYESFPYVYGQQQYGGNSAAFNQPAETQHESDDDMGQYLQSIGINVDQELIEERLEDKIRHVHSNVGISVDELIYREANAISKSTDLKDVERKQRVKLSEFLRETTKSERETITSDMTKHHAEYRETRDYHLENHQALSENKPYKEKVKGNSSHPEKRISVSNHTYLPQNEFTQETSESKTLDGKNGLAYNRPSAERKTEGKIEISNNFVFMSKNTLRQADSLPNSLDAHPVNSEGRPIKPKTLISTQPQNYFHHKNNRQEQLSPKKDSELVPKEQQHKAQNQIQQGPLTYQYSDSSVPKESTPRAKIISGNKSHVIGNLKKFAEECKIDFDSLEPKSSKMRSKSPMLAPCKKEITQIAKTTSNDDQSVYLNSGSNLPKVPSRPLLDNSSHKEKSIEKFSTDIKSKQNEHTQLTNSKNPEPQFNEKIKNASPQSPDIKKHKKETNELPSSSEVAFQTKDSGSNPNLPLQTNILKTADSDFFAISHLPPIVIPLASSKKAISQEEFVKHQGHPKDPSVGTLVNLLSSDNFFSNTVSESVVKPLLAKKEASSQNIFQKHYGSPKKLTQMAVIQDPKARSLTPNQTYVRVVPDSDNAMAKIKVLVPNEPTASLQKNLESPLIQSDSLQHNAKSETKSPSKVFANKLSHRELTITTSDEPISKHNHIVINQPPGAILIKVPQNSEPNFLRANHDQNSLPKHNLVNPSQFIQNPNQIILTPKMAPGQNRPKPVFEILPEDISMPRSHKGSFRNDNLQHFHSNVATPRKEDGPGFLYNTQTMLSTKDLKPLLIPQPPMLYSNNLYANETSNSRSSQNQSTNQSIENKIAFRNPSDSSQMLFQNNGPHITSFQTQQKIENEYYFYEEFQSHGNPPYPKQPQYNIYQNYVPTQSQRVIFQSPNVIIQPNIVFHQGPNPLDKVVRVSNGALDKPPMDRGHQIISNKNLNVQQWPVLYQPTFAPKVQNQNSQASTNTVWMNALNSNQQPGLKQISIQEIKLPQVYAQKTGVTNQVYVQPQRSSPFDPKGPPNRPESSRNPMNRYQ